MWFLEQYVVFNWCLAFHDNADNLSNIWRLGPCYPISKERFRSFNNELSKSISNLWKWPRRQGRLEEVWSHLRHYGLVRWLYLASYHYYSCSSTRFGQCLCLEGWLTSRLGVHQNFHSYFTLISDNQSRHWSYSDSDINSPYQKT